MAFKDNTLVEILKNPSGCYFQFFILGFEL